jgi:activating signal cointegrator 1
MITLPAISLWQPWAHLLAIGAKRYETRSWSTPYRGPMAIHASKKWMLRMASQCYEEPFFTILSSHGIRFPARCDQAKLPGLGLAFGAVVAVGRLIDIRPTSELLREIGTHERAFGDFSHGRWAWEYTDVVALETPMPYRGRQGIFRVDLPEEVASREVNLEQTS